VAAVEVAARGTVNASMSAEVGRRMLQRYLGAAHLPTQPSSYSEVVEVR
jgi:hypothetical protein